MSTYEVRYGDVVVGDDGAHGFVHDIDGPIPVGLSWAVFRFTGPDLRTGRTRTIAVRVGDRVELFPLVERVVQFVCKQGGEYLLWDADANEMLNIPQAAHPVWTGELAPNTPVRVRLYNGRPVWVCGRAEDSPPIGSPPASG